MVLICVTHTPHYALLTLQTASTHTPPPPFSRCGWASQPWYSPQEFKIRWREREGREKKREQESGNKMHLFLKHLLNLANVHYSYVYFVDLFHSTTTTVHMSIIQHFSSFFVVFMFARPSASRERNHSTWGRTGIEKRVEKDKGGVVSYGFDMSPVFVLVIGSVSSVCGCYRCIYVGLLVGSEVEGSGGFKGRGLALGLFAALSFPLSTLAHLHLCQLDVPQDVGVCDGERRRKCDECEVEKLLHFNQCNLVW